MQTSFYPMELADRGAKRLMRPGHIEQGTVQYLAETLKIRQVGYRDWITVRTPNATEADFFKLPADGRVSMYEIFRTAFDQAGQPVRLTVTVYPTDRNQFIIDIGDVPKFPSEQGAGNRLNVHTHNLAEQAGPQIGSGRDPETERATGAGSFWP